MAQSLARVAFPRARTAIHARNRGVSSTTTSGTDAASKHPSTIGASGPVIHTQRLDSSASTSWSASASCMGAESTGSGRAAFQVQPEQSRGQFVGEVGDICADHRYVHRLAGCVQRKRQFDCPANRVNDLDGPRNRTDRIELAASNPQLCAQIHRQRCSHRSATTRRQGKASNDGPHGHFGNFFFILPSRHSGLEHSPLVLQPISSATGSARAKFDESTNPSIQETLVRSAIGLRNT